MNRQLKMYWFLPLEPDVSYIGTWPSIGPEPTVEYLSKIVKASENGGFDGLLVHTGYSLALETWVAAASVLGKTERSQLILAVRPNQYHPAQLAKMAASLCKLFPGRIALNVVTGQTQECKWIGNYDDRETRYQRIKEWFEITSALWYEDEIFTYNGVVYKLEENYFHPKLSQRIEIFFSGGSKEATEIALKYGDTYLLFGEPVEKIRNRISLIKSMKNSSSLRFGLRMHIIVRQTEDEAWNAASELISRVDPEIKEFLCSQKHSESMDRKNQQLLATSNDLIIGPNLWAGIGTARLGNATALVGNPQQIVERLIEYWNVGIDTFILSGYPKLDEANRFGEMVMPLLKTKLNINN
ncbi:LLM class flavin-dependent oxidoreductase [Paenibacillus lautus]|uniref:LLM class flavin-dependent oxidoreductase n=1 Tax=Paenibacillus lautus TaxID=1401 RepID=UPI000FDA1078|nr:LLM class flavin-dependent oxidoreductase [Paenibacillus lautus]